MPWMRVTGNRGIPVGRGGIEQEKRGRMYIDTSKANGVELVSFERVIFYREGNESLVAAPKGSRCHIGTFARHPFHEGEMVYDLGENPLHPGNRAFSCKAHLYDIPTESRVYDQFGRSHYTEVKFTKL